MKIIKTIYASLMMIPVLIWFIIVFFVWRILIINEKCDFDIDNQSD